MAEWSGEYISPYAEHGKKSEQVKKITVSIPLKVLKILTDERTRRQVNNLRHATNSELLCEAFLHALPDNRCLTMKTCVKSAAMRSRKRRKRLCVNWESTRIRGNTETIKRAE
ncbi:transcriptional repressor protein MetJ [Klebsiella pneumoniae]|uniref:Met repressor n=1 Tax=Klebsiella pneumoniae TaxID=573 RepID=A0A3S5DHI3_KLEPN|nr:transcriptional repressor protein MetJ [Klebsiella pneumoniae]